MDKTMTLCNDILTLEVSTHGAEAVSLRKQGRELLWTGDPTYWNRHAPILFPAVGKPCNNELHVDGKSITMKQHGYARDCEFECVNAEMRGCEDGDASVTLALPQTTVDALVKSNTYPYRLGLAVTYRLVGSTVEAVWTVENLDERDAWFQIGAHPGFLLPNYRPDDAMHGYVRYYGRDGRPVRPVVVSGLADGNRVPLEQPLTVEPLMPLADDTFAHDALMFEGGQVACAELCDKEMRPVLRVSCPQAEAYGIWAPHKAGCPFVCLEPWCGICDAQGFAGDISQRQYIHRLAPAERYTFSYCIDVM